MLPHCLIVLVTQYQIYSKAPESALQRFRLLGGEFIRGNKKGLVGISGGVGCLKPQKLLPSPIYHSAPHQTTVYMYYCTLFILIYKFKVINFAMTYYITFICYPPITVLLLRIIKAFSAFVMYAFSDNSKITNMIIAV